MKRTMILIAVTGLCVGSIWVWWGMRQASNTDGSAIIPATLSVHDIPARLPGTVLHVPVTDTDTADVVIDTYILGGDRVIGGAVSHDGGAVVANVIVPNMDQSLARGSWVYSIERDGVSYALVPIYVNFGGTGTFLMIGTFVYDPSTGELMHTDLHFIDDRVAFEGFAKGSDDTVLLHYLTRAEGESMADTPVHAAVREVRVVAGKLVIVE